MGLPVGIKFDHTWEALSILPGSECILSKYLMSFSDIFWVFMSIFCPTGKKGRRRVVRGQNLCIRVTFLGGQHPLPDLEALAAGNPDSM